jgi:hypothetical protein
MTVAENESLGSVAVYRFMTCDRPNNTFVENVRMATAATIRRLKGMADLPSDLDSDGFWREPAGSAEATPG